LSRNQECLALAKSSPAIGQAFCQRGRMVALPNGNIYKYLRLPWTILPICQRLSGAWQNAMPDRLKEDEDGRER
jgi:hypothetical protein